MDNLWHVTTVFVVSLLAANGMSIEDRQREKEQIEFWEQKILSLSVMPFMEKYETLSLGLRSMARRKTIPGHSADVERIYASLLAEINNDPKHAENFQALLESKRIDGAKGYSAYQDHFDRHLLIDETLIHIRSPEVIALLGKYLSDDRDTPGPEIVHSDCSIVPANSHLAMGALKKIGIKNPPIKEDQYGLIPQEDIATWKLWWEQVKAGTRTFSFEGKDIAYRFKKDGGYEIISKDVAKRINYESRVDIPKEERMKEVRSLSIQTLAIIVVICLLLIGLYWVKWRKASSA
jgi:hypothetical protein